MRIRKDPNCAVCGENPTVTELIDYEAFCGVISDEAADAARESTISVRDLAQMLERARARRARLPARRRSRAGRARDRLCRWVGADPQERVLAWATLLSSCRTTSRSSSTARSGQRSAEVLAVAKGAGFANAQHVGGGVVAWVNQIEPAKPIY